MARVTVIVGLVLVALGFYGYFTSDSHAPTALIPAGFGIVLLILGALAFKDKMRKHSMHVAAIIGLIGFLGTGVMAIKAAMSDNANQRAMTMQILMSLICAIFVGLCVKSFIDARKRRQANEQQSRPQ